MAITDGQLLVGTSAGDALKLSTLTAGAGVTITNAAGAITISASAAQDTVVTSTAVGTQNDFSPGLSGNTLLRMNNASDVTITGIASGTSGQRVTIVSVGTGNVFLAHQNAGSTAGNRLINAVTVGTTPLAAGTGTAIIAYDATTSRWRLVSHSQGAPISVSYASSDFTGSASMTWTVDSGDVAANQYRVVGTTLHWALKLKSTSVGGTVDTNLRVVIPNGFNTPSLGGVGGTPVCLYQLIDNGGSPQVGLAAVSSLDFTHLELTKLNVATVMTASTNNTSIQGYFVFGIS